MTSGYPAKVEKSEKENMPFESQEENRIKALFEYKIDFTTSEEVLDEITFLLSIICDTPIACITLLDSNKVWFKSKVGLELVSLDKSISFSNHVIQQNTIFEITNSLEDPRFIDHPMVKGLPGIQYFAGIPLVSHSGYNIGVLCVLDYKKRFLNDHQKIALRSLAKNVIIYFELNRYKKNLDKTNQKANECAKVKEEFLCNMSHEIRTPLNAICGFTELLSKTFLKKNQREMLNIMKSSVDILMAFINNILDFSKIEYGNITITNHPFNLHKSIIDLKDLFSHKALEKNLELSFDIDKKLPQIINGDKIRLYQILINLVGNAIKFTHKGKVKLAIKLIEENEEKIGINFSVMDSGKGIEKNKIKSIFEKYQKGNTDISQKYEGLGLGLSMSKSLVEIQGGELSVDSEIGVGSIFNFTLLFNKLSEEKIIKYYKEEKLKDENKIEQEKLYFNNELQKIIKKDVVELLICDDTLFNLILIDKIFENSIVRVDHAENGKIGLEKFEKKNYDIILLDLKMPEMDGFEFASVIRNIKKSDVIILAMTANNSCYEKQKCFDLGMNDYFTKPFERKNLLNGIIKNFKDKYNKLNSFYNSNIIICEDLDNTNINNLNNSKNLIYDNLFNNIHNIDTLNSTLSFNFDGLILKDNMKISICNSKKKTNQKESISFGKGKDDKRKKINKNEKINTNSKINLDKSAILNSFINQNKINNDSLNESITSDTNKSLFFYDLIAEEYKNQSIEKEKLQGLDMLKIIRKGNNIKFYINEEEYESDLNLIRKDFNFKSSVTNSLIETESENENLKLKYKMDENISYKIKNQNSTNNYNMSDFSTQDEIYKEKKNYISVISSKESSKKRY